MWSLRWGRLVNFSSKKSEMEYFIQVRQTLNPCGINCLGFCGESTQCRVRRSEIFCAIQRRETYGVSPFKFLWYLCVWKYKCFVRSLFSNKVMKFSSLRLSCFICYHILGYWSFRLNMMFCYRYPWSLRPIQRCLKSSSWNCQEP